MPPPHCDPLVGEVAVTEVTGTTVNRSKISDLIYRIHSINRLGRLLNFLTLRVGANSRWALIRGWVLIKFSPFSASVVVYFATKQ